VRWIQNVQDRKHLTSVVNNFYTKVTSTPATQYALCSSKLQHGRELHNTSLLTSLSINSPHDSSMYIIPQNHNQKI